MPKDFTPLFIFAVALLVVLRRSGRAQRVNMGRAWVLPAIGLLSVWNTLSKESFPSAVAILILVAGSALGIAAGWFRALHVELTVNPETGEVMSKATPIGTYLIIGFMALRILLGYAFHGTPGGGYGHAPPSIGAAKHGVDLFRLADAALLFSTFMSATQRLEIFRRARPILAQHVAQKNAAGAPPTDA